MARFTVERLDHVQVNVTDLDAAREFYGTVLGLAEIPRPPSFDFAGAWFAMGNCVLHLVVRDAEPVSARHFCLWVGDVHAEARVLVAKNIDVRWETKYKIEGIDRFFVHDPAGNRIELQGAETTGRG